MKTKKTQYMAFMALFLAIQILLVVTPLGYLPLGPIDATTMHIPVIVAAIVFGRKAGAQLGLVFGITSVLNATFRPNITSFVFSPFVTVAIVPRILLGYFSGVLFEVLKKHKVNEQLCIITASLAGAITNTVLVLGGIYFFFGEAYAKAVHVAYEVLSAVLLGVVTTNGIAEAVLGAIACLLIVKALAPFMKKYQK